MSEQAILFLEAYRESRDVNIAAAKANFALSWCAENKPKDYYVYGLVDPVCNELFYVGKGKGKRWQVHAKMAKSESPDANKRKIERILAIYDAGELDIPVINIADGLSESDALIVEGQFIKRLEQYLTNSSLWIRSAQWAHKVKARREAEAKQLLAKDLLRHYGLVQKLKAWLSPLDDDSAKLFSHIESLVLKRGTQRVQNAGAQESKA